MRASHQARRPSSRGGGSDQGKQQSIRRKQIMKQIEIKAEPPDVNAGADTQSDPMQCIAMHNGTPKKPVVERTGLLRRSSIHLHRANHTSSQESGEVPSFALDEAAAGWLL